MNKIFIALLIALSSSVHAQSDYENDRLGQFKHLNEKIENLEKALRLQGLVNTAVNNEDYELACKAQSTLKNLVEKADIRDLIQRNKDYQQAYCGIKKYSKLFK
jgi:hypothetical protein